MTGNPLGRGVKSRVNYLMVTGAEGKSIGERGEGPEAYMRDILEV